MRIHAIARAAISIIAVAGCSGELAQHPPAEDPTSVAAVEAPFRPLSSYQPDPSPSVKPATPAADYTCPMHPDVHTSKPGQCPKCGMTLVPAKQGGQ